jgi:hypothetical protein
MQKGHVPYLKQHYDSYKRDHFLHNQKVFVKEHEHDSWFKEKYDPEVRYQNWKYNVEKARRVNPNEDYLQDVNHLTVSLRSLPVWITREMIQHFTGNADVYFSEPLKMSGYERICWIRFS